MMNNDVLYQEKDRAWMINVIFYVACVILGLVIFTYAIFYFKAYMGNQEIMNIDKNISLYGTTDQKQQEAQVFDYKKKIDDFAGLLANHTMSSNIFTFLETNTLPGVIFSGFTLSTQKDEIRLSGQADNLSALGKQFTAFEHNKDSVQSISVVNSQIASSGKINFVFNISLDQKIFAYHQ